MQKKIIKLLIAFFLLFVFQAIFAQAASDCVNKYEGQCIDFNQNCPSGYTNLTTSSATGASSYGCEGSWIGDPNERCCVPSCSSGNQCVAESECTTFELKNGNKLPCSAAYTDNFCCETSTSNPSRCEPEYTCFDSNTGGEVCNGAVYLGDAEKDNWCKDQGRGDQCCQKSNGCERNNYTCTKDKSECKSTTSSSGTYRADCLQSYGMKEGDTGSENVACCSEMNTAECGSASGYTCADVATGNKCADGYTESTEYACKTVNGTQPKCCKKNSTNSGTEDIHYGYEPPLTVTSFTEWLKNFLASVQGIVGWLAVIMIVVGGIVYITSGGSSTQTTLGKQIIIWALVGFVIAVAAPSLLKEIVDLAKSGSQTTSDVIENANPVKQIVTNVLEFLLAAIGVLALLGFTIGGVMYVTSAGDKERADTAKRAVVYSIIAICLAGAGLVIVKQVLDLIGTKVS